MKNKKIKSKNKLSKKARLLLLDELYLLLTTDYEKYLETMRQICGFYEAETADEYAQRYFLEKNV